MKVTFVILLVLTSTSCFTATLTLEDVHKIWADHIEHGNIDGSIGPIRLAGLDYCVDLDIGSGLKVVAISGNLHGGLLLFDHAGKMLSLVETPEIQEVRLFNPEEDPPTPLGLVATEVDDIGTGVAEYNYHVYRVMGGTLKEVWKGLAYFLDGNGAKVQERQGFIRFHPSGWGDSYLKLIHIVGPMQNGRFDQHVFVYKDGKFVERKGKIVAGS